MSLGWEGPHFEINHLIVTRRRYRLNRSKIGMETPPGSLHSKSTLRGF